MSTEWTNEHRMLVCMHLIAERRMQADASVNTEHWTSNNNKKRTKSLKINDIK